MAKKEKNKYSIYLFVAMIIIVMFGIAILADYYMGLNSAEDLSASEGAVAEETENDLAGQATGVQIYDKCVQDCNAKKIRGGSTSAAPSLTSTVPSLTSTPKSSESQEYAACMEGCNKLGNQLNVFWCKDSDGDSPNAKYIKGITYSTYNPGGKVDDCYTFFSGKVRLIEGKCVGNNYQLDYIDCEKGCKAGACIS